MVDGSQFHKTIYSLSHNHICPFKSSSFNSLSQKSHSHLMGVYWNWMIKYTSTAKHTLIKSTTLHNPTYFIYFISILPLFCVVFLCDVAIISLEIKIRIWEYAILVTLCFMFFFNFFYFWHFYFIILQLFFLELYLFFIF